jgi:hypothetical protein
MALSPQFEFADDFSEGLAVVQVDEQYGYIDHTGKMVIPLEFSNAEKFSNGLARAAVDDKWGIIDKTGKFIIQPKYLDIEDFSEGLALVTIDKEWGYIDRTGRRVWPPAPAEPQRESCKTMSDIFAPQDLVLTHEETEDTPAQRHVLRHYCTIIGRCLAFDGETYKVSGPDVEVKTYDRSMAKMHCIIKRVDETRFTIEDYKTSPHGGGPTTGTWVNGERITGPMFLKEGDVVRFGPNIEFKVSFDASQGGI